MELILHIGLISTFACFAAGSLLALLFGAMDNDKTSWLLAHGAATLGGLIGLATGLGTILSGIGYSIQSQAGIGIAGGVITLHVDALAGLFIATISVVAIAASIYGLGCYAQYLGTYRLGHFGFFYNLFLASMLLVVAANNSILFLFAWELMAISSYFLVIFERHEEKNIEAGTLYILISQLGAGLLFAAFLLLYRFTGSFDFDTIRASVGAIPFLIQHIILGLALVGLASKAGVIPLHIWLPEAHPAAPSHVSALLSGVMIKTAIFMLIRFFIEFFPSAALLWGLCILTLGAISSLLGVLYALAEHDIKRLLAFHSVENIGIILLGLGAAIVFFALNIPALGILALAAALYHTVNHAIFKSLLFLGAGSVVHATHTRDMERYGGIIRVMPWTAFFFLIGAVAISGLPPFNGFVSEWLTFQSLFAGIAVLPTVEKLFMLFGASSLAFTGGLAAACFVKAFGVTFLARPRSDACADAHESPFAMQLGMGILAVLTLVCGVMAGSIAPILAQICITLRGAHIGVPFVVPAAPLEIGMFSSLAMTDVALAIAVGIVATVLFTWMRSGRRRIVVARTWDCGAPLTPRMEITATGFSRTLITIFGGILRPSMRVEASKGSRYATLAKTIHLSIPNLYETYLYAPAVALVETIARHARRIQTGNVNTYLLYIFLTVLLLLYGALAR